MAIRGQQILGYISTRPRDDQFVAGPLYVVPGGNRGLIAMRLGEAYERVLRALGVTEYRFGVDLESKSYLTSCRRIEEFEEEGEFNGHVVFRRRL